MKFFALSLMALGASAAPATLTQVHHTVGMGHTQHGLAHKQVVAAPVTFKVAEPLHHVAYDNKIQTVAYAQPTYAQTFVQPTTTILKPAVQAVQYVTRPVQTFVAPTIQTAQYRGEINLPVHQVDRTIEYMDVPHVEKPAEMQTFRVGPSGNTIHLHFDTQSSQLTTSQSHNPAPAAEPKYQESQDETSYLKAKIVKPVVQHVTETVSPHREVTYEVLPLNEKVKTVVAKATHERVQYTAPEVQVQHQQVHHHQQIVKPIEITPTYLNTYNVQPQTVLKNVVQTFTKPVEYVQAQTYTKPIEYVQAQTFAKPIEFVQAQTFAKPIEYVQGQTFEIAQPVEKIATTLVKPAAQITKEVFVDKAAETLAY